MPVSYSVTDTTGVTLHDIYIPDSGTYVFPVWVKFLTGYVGDKVTLSFSGLPADVRVTPDSFSAVPTYTERFVFYTNHAARASYQVTLVAYTPTTGYKYFKFKLGVIPAFCPAAFLGNLSGRSACDTSGNYPYTATADTFQNIMYVHNFGGYGTSVGVELILDCTTDSVFIPLNNYGNSVVMKGQGIFTANQIIIWYHASSTPNGHADNCVDTLTVVP
ncbi:MAG: hypothetical protein ACHQD8_04905 [Chitinophagales bacterium]